MMPLLAERHKEIFCQPPVHKGSVAVGPGHAQVGKLSHLGIGALCRGHETVALVQIDKHLHFVSRVLVLPGIFLGHQHVNAVAVEHGTVVGEADDAQFIVVSQFHRMALWVSRGCRSQ